MEDHDTLRDAIVLQLIVTEYDEHGRPIGEATSSLDEGVSAPPCLTSGPRSTRPS